MSGWSEFLIELFDAGRIPVRGRPDPREGWDGAVVETLNRAFRRFQLSVPGPRLDFDVGIAMQSADVVRWSAWLLVSRTEPGAEVGSRVRLETPPASPSAHLSADLLLRYLPPIRRRAGAISPEDPLARGLTDILRAWPLSGVLSEVTDAPTTPPEFGHPGLSLLYAERWLETEKPLWRPEGSAAGYLEWVSRKPGAGVPRPEADGA